MVEEGRCQPTTPKAVCGYLSKNRCQETQGALASASSDARHGVPTNISCLYSLHVSSTINYSLTCIGVG